LTAQDLDISPLAIEMSLQAPRPVVHEYFDIEESGASLEEFDVDDGDPTDDAMERPIRFLDAFSEIMVLRSRLDRSDEPPRGSLPRFPRESWRESHVQT
jgi:hypothetical protein